MTGRGRGKPCKAKSPDAEGAKRKTRLDKIKQVPLPSSQDDTEKENETANKRKPKQKQVNHGEEKPSIQNAREEANLRTNKEDTKTPAKGTNAKTCADRTKPMERFAAEPEKPGRTIKRCGGKAKAGEQNPEVMTKMKSDIPNDTTKASTPKAKACGGKAKPRVKFAEETPETQLEHAEAKTGKVPEEEKLGKAKTCADEAKLMEESIERAITPKDKTAVDSVLNTTLKNLKIKKNDRSKASQVVNEITDNIIKHLKQNTQCFKEVEEPLRSGSYYENLKISSPDEFDVMVPILVERINVEPFGDDGAFYSVALKRGNSLLKTFQENDILCASKMLQEFREEVKKCVKKYKEWVVTKKKPGCPAVTLTREVESVTISLDVVLCLKVKSSWPSFTKEGLKIEGWLGAKVRQDHRLKPYYLVPKYEGKGNVENDNGVLAKDIWRVSFSHVEKAILMNHGSEKTCCEREGASCCRKDCLKLLKHLLSLLKENDSSFDKFCSYHAKTTLFHACCSRTKDSDWKASDLSLCFHLLLEDFEGHLQRGELPNFFIPSQNLISGPGRKKCKHLADRIKEERHKGFPIFRQQLHVKGLV
uniref:Cyclic GMP-AMP synthase n=1 Tax=Amphiprion percula TaxID=161767 RepID=A0A3P8RLV9_AMPPE